MPDIWLDVDAAVTIPVNVVPLVDDTDFKSIEEAIAYNESGMDLNWNFVQSDGTITQTNVVPTTSGDYDWTHVGNGIYKIEMPASGGASANNDTKGYGWFSGVCDGVLPFVGPRIGFRAAALNDAYCDGGDYPQVDLVQIGGVTQSATDLKDFADTGYDPSPHKVLGVVLTDGCTSNSDMRGTDGASTHAAADVVTALGTGSTLTDCATASGFSTHSAADVVTALGTGATLTACLTATGFALATVCTEDRLAELDAGNLPADVDAILEDTGTTIPGTLTTIAGYVDTEIGTIQDTLTAMQGATFSTDTDSLEAIRNRGDLAWTTGEGGTGLTAEETRAALGLAAANLDTQLGDIADDVEALAVTAGSGAWTVTITVDDGTDPLESATVRATKGAESYQNTTDADGEAAFALDSGTWTVAITLFGHTFTSTTLVISADTEQTYSMIAVSITASEPGQVTGYLYCYDEEGVVESSASVTIWQVDTAESEGYAYDSTERTETSDATGLVEFTGLFVGGTYRLKRGTTGESEKFTIPGTASDPYELTSVLGKP